MLMVMTKMMDTEQVGYYTLSLSITNPIIMFSMLQLRAVHVTDIRDEHRYGCYLGVRLLTNGVAALVLIGVLAVLAGRYDGLVYGIIFIVFANKAIESTADITYAVLQKHERLDKVAKSTILRQGAGAAALIGTLWLTNNLLLGVAAIGICWLAVLFLYDQKNVSVFETWKPRWNLQAYKSIILAGIPLGITRGLISLNESIPRFFIEGHQGTSAQGIFSAMAYAMTVAYLCIEALGYSAIARLARYYNENPRAYVRLLFKVTAFAFLIGVVGVAITITAGRQILSLLYTPEYAENPEVFVWLMVLISGKMVSSMLNHGMNAARYFKSQVPLNILQLLITSGCCLWMIPLYGLKGAVWGMLVGMIFKIVGSIIVIKLALKQSNSIKNIL